VLEDVLNGYVSLERAERDYGVVIRSTRRPDERVSLPKHFSIDAAATASLRSSRNSG
jgi:N-methylhydantoinase B/oxoprolinase/acetone carboxylase alpha subunit